MRLNLLVGIWFDGLPKLQKECLYRLHIRSRALQASQDSIINKDMKAI